MKEELLKNVKNDIYLSNNDIKILNKYNINYQDFNSFKDLIFYLEEFVNQDGDDDLEDLLIKISEYNYYFRTNK